ATTSERAPNTSGAEVLAGLGAFFLWVARRKGPPRTSTRVDQHPDEAHPHVETGPTGAVRPILTRRQGAGWLRSTLVDMSKKVSRTLFNPHRRVARGLAASDQPLSTCR